MRLEAAGENQLLQILLVRHRISIIAGLLSRLITILFFEDSQLGVKKENNV